VDDETVSVIVAITPLPIMFSLIPKSRQLPDPALALQETDLLAAVAAGPASTLMEVKSAAEYTITHCSAAGWDVPKEFSVRFSVTVPPGVAVADDSAKVCCPNMQLHAASRKGIAAINRRNSNDKRSTDICGVINRGGLATCTP